MENLIRKKAYEKLAEKVIKSLKERHFDAMYFSNIDEARNHVLSSIPKDKTVGFGGSLTLSETGILDALKSGGYCMIDREKAKTPEERKMIQRKALSSDYFLMSANAISEDGVIVNMDGNGNRAAAMVYGPDRVIVICGMNKVAKTVEDAVSRVRNIASPINAQRFDISTPCKKTASCANCKCADSICANLVITRLSRPEGRIQVILIGEELGF